jgi:hypothetical protein
VHNGFFCNLRGDLEYISESYDHFDNCAGDTLSLSWINETSLSWINETLRTLGCERDGRLQVYWLLPGRDLTDGLVLIEKQSDIRPMIEASKTENQLVLFIDHTNFIQRLRGDVYERARIGQTKPDNNCPSEVHMGGPSEEDRNASVPPTVVASSSSSAQIPGDSIAAAPGECVTAAAGERVAAAASAVAG